MTRYFFAKNTLQNKAFLKSQYSSTQILCNTRYLFPPNTPQAEAPRKWAPHSIIAHFPPAVNRQIAQTFNPKIVQNTIVQNDESHAKALKPTGGVDFSVLKY